MGRGYARQALAQALYQRTDGHPLFLVTVVDALVQQGLVREVDGRWAVPGDSTVVEDVMPESLRALLVQQCTALSAAAQRMLEAASVAGLESTVAVIAAGVEAAEEAAEASVRSWRSGGSSCGRTGWRNGRTAP